MIGNMHIDTISRINYMPEKGNLLDEYLAKFLAKYPSFIKV